MNGTKQLQYEGIALIILMILIAASIPLRFFYPALHPFPEWIDGVLLALWFVGFLQWAIKGGMPMRV